MENQAQQVQLQPEQKKKWYKNPWWIIVFVIAIIWTIIDVSLDSAQEKEAGKKEQAVIADQSIKDQEKKIEQQKTQEAEDAKRIKEEAEKAEQQKKEEEQLKILQTGTTEEKLGVIFDKSISYNRTDYQIKYDEKAKNIEINTRESFWDANHLVVKAYYIFVKYGMEAFKIDGVESMTVGYQINFTDSYGKKYTDDAVVLTMSKEEFLKYDWENLNGEVIYRQMQNSCSEHYINPTIAKDLEYDKLWLTL